MNWMNTNKTSHRASFLVAGAGLVQNKAKFSEKSEDLLTFMSQGSETQKIEQISGIR